MEMYERVAKLEIHSEDTDRRLDEMDKRFDKNEAVLESIHDLASGMKQTSADVNEMKNDIKETRADVEELKHKGGDMAKKILSYIATACGGAFLTWVIGLIASAV